MRSRVRRAIAAATVCVAAGAALTMAIPAAGETAGVDAVQSADPTGAAVQGDWCPVGMYTGSGRCCLIYPDACGSGYPALPRPHIADPQVTLSTPLSGTEQSETTPGDPDATGSVSLTTKPNISQVCFTISMSGMNLTAIAGHVHKAPRGQTSVVPVVDMLENVNSNGTISQCRFADPVTIRDMRVNPRAYYVQIHNLNYPEGAIRGQLGD